MKKFNNREAAGEELAEKLMIYKNKPCVVMAIPRGGVPVGYAICKQLRCPMGLVWVKKIGHPLSPELAIGAVSPDDHIIDYKSAASDLYLKNEIEKIRSRFKEMKSKLNDKSENIDLKDKVIIVVDDGIATGHTIEAAIKMLRGKTHAKIIVATPVASENAVKNLAFYADEVVVAYVPDIFLGIGGFYTDFTQLSDEETAAYIKKSERLIMDKKSAL
jgi:putative phosphoribosyl transferase